MVSRRLRGKRQHVQKITPKVKLIITNKQRYPLRVSYRVLTICRKKYGWCDRCIMVSDFLNISTNRMRCRRLPLNYQAFLPAHSRNSVFFSVIITVYFDVQNKLFDKEDEQMLFSEHRRVHLSEHKLILIFLLDH